MVQIHSRILSQRNPTGRDSTLKMCKGVGSTPTVGIKVKIMAKSLIKQRREQNAICDKCRSPDYIMYPNDSFPGAKPNFQCNSCGNTWQYGKSGGKFAKLASKKL